jgi:hypothetical protein
MQFRGEHEPGIEGNFAHPQPGQFRLDVSVKRSVDLDHIEALGQELERVLLPALHSGGIENSIPVFLTPSGGADADLPRCVHGMRVQRYELAG